MPAWVTDGMHVYTRRLPPHLTLELKEITPGHRSRGADIRRARAQEAKALLRAVRGGAHVVALDQSGRSWSTADLAGRLKVWLEEAREVALLVGGPDGLDRDCLEAAAERWSLGPLTLPHTLVRIVIAEQIYRAWTILSGHPYHRE